MSKPMICKPVFSVRPAVALDMICINSLGAAEFFEKELERGGRTFAGNAYTALLNDLPIGIAGVYEITEGRGMAWSHIDHDLAGPYMRQIHKATKDFLDMAMASGAYYRIEMAVLSSFEKGKKWASMLGFQYEGTLRHFTPQGEDHDLFSRVNLWP